MFRETANNPLLRIVIIAKKRHFTIEAATSLLTFRAYFIQINIVISIRNNKAIYIFPIRMFASIHQQISARIKKYFVALL